MFLLSNAQLLELCQFLLTATQPYYPLASDYLRDLFYTGCRSMEPLTPALWQFNPAPGDGYLLQPLKGNFVREILPGRMSANFDFAIENNIQPYNGLTLRQLEYSMKIINPCGNMTVGNRETVTYIFRYNYINTLLAEGLTTEEIRVIMGWYNPGMPHSYASKDVYVQFNPFPL